jgi:hypothetical protein
LFFVPDATQATPVDESISLPLGFIGQLEYVKKEDVDFIELSCKDFRTVKLVFTDTVNAPKNPKIFFDLLKKLVFPSKITNTFAFQNKQRFTLPETMNAENSVWTFQV